MEEWPGGHHNVMNSIQRFPGDRPLYLPFWTKAGSMSGVHFAKIEINKFKIRDLVAIEKFRQYFCFVLCRPGTNNMVSKIRN